MVLIKPAATVKQKILELKERQPNITCDEAAKTVGCSRYWAYCVLRKKYPTSPRVDSFSDIKSSFPKFISVKDFAARMNIDYQEALGMVRKKEVKAWRAKHGGHWWVYEEDAEIDSG